MKHLMTPREVMQQIVKSLNIHYLTHFDKRKGIIQFHFTLVHENYSCYISIDNNELFFHEGKSPNKDVEINCSFHLWLKIAQKKVSPSWGVITRRLRIKGDRSFIKILSQSTFPLSLGEKSDPLTTFEQSPTKKWHTPEKVLVINASPRGKRGYTYLLTHALVEGLQQGGTEVKEVFLENKEVKSCKGCWSCWLKDTGHCIIKDDFSSISDLEQEADLVIFSLPLYVDGMPGILKNYFDRSVKLNYPYMENDAERIRHPRRNKKQQSMAVLGVCGFWSKKNFKALSHHFHAISINQHRPLLAEIYRSSIMYLFNHPLLYFEQHKIVSSVKQAGLELVKKGRVSSNTKRVIEKEICTSNEFVNRSNEFWAEKVKLKETSY